MNLPVATTILQQLGGARFMAMTGCRNPVGGENFLQLNLRRNNTKATYLKVTLNAMDLYDLEFFKLNPKTFDIEVKATHEGVYFDMLPAVFTQATGLYTSL